MNSPHLSIALPVYNEEDSLPVLYQRLTRTLEELGHSYELLFVDDGSSDRSVEILRELRRSDPRVRLLRFSRNFGHHVALTAGLDHARGQHVVLMDSDLQDQPEEIPRLYDALMGGYDVVYGARQNKRFSPAKRALSWGFRWAMEHLLGAPFEGGVFRIMRAQVVRELRRCTERDRVIVELCRWVGFRQTSIPVEHGAREGGQSKYPFKAQLALALSALTSSSTRPLRLAWLAGGSFALLGGLGSLGWLLCAAFADGPPRTSWLLLAAVFLVGGVQLLCLGAFGEYLARIFRETQGRPLYILLKEPSSTKPDPSNSEENGHAIQVE